MRLVLSRIAVAVPTLVIVLLVSMLLVELTPGDPASVLAGDGATEAQIEMVRDRLNLDQSVPQRFVSYVGDLLGGDMGRSFRSNQLVTTMIGKALPVSMSLVVMAMAFTVLLGVPAGALAAVYRGRFVDRALTAVSSVFVAVPPFVVALLLVVPLAVNRNWLPATGYVGLDAGFWEWARRLMMPSFALALPSAAEVARQLRGAMVDTLEHDFIRAQHAKGLSQAKVLGKHAAKSAAMPVVTVIGLQVGRLLGGSVVVEQVFVLPGLGSLGFQAVLGYDYPTIQGIVLVSAVTILLVNLLVDCSYLFFNPRLRGGS